MKYTIKLQLKTLDERNTLISDMEELNELLYLTDENSVVRRHYLVSTYNSFLSPDIYGYIVNPSLLATNLKNVASYIKTLINRANKIDIVSLNIPFIPSSSFINSVHSHLSAMIQGEFVLKFNVNPSIILGFTLDYRGIHVERTLKHLVNNYTQKHRDEILSGI